MGHETSGNENVFNSVVSDIAACRRWLEKKLSGEFVDLTCLSQSKFLKVINGVIVLFYSSRPMKQTVLSIEQWTNVFLIYFDCQTPRISYKFVLLFKQNTICLKLNPIGWIKYGKFCRLNMY
jgi:hypothetical protein